MAGHGLPPRQGLYDPANEHDACGFGFVVDVKARPSHDIVRKALQVLCNLEHRGATGSEKNTGDGAGLLIADCRTPSWLRDAGRWASSCPRRATTASGCSSSRSDLASRQACQRKLEEIVVRKGRGSSGWRDVPTDSASLGATARASQPVIRQLLVARGPQTPAGRRLRAEALRHPPPRREGRLPIGAPGPRLLLRREPLGPDRRLQGDAQRRPARGLLPRLWRTRRSRRLAMVHSRFSTNTFPSWSRSHPYRYISHNGEINTLRGNVNWMQARQRMFESRLFGDDLQKVLPGDRHRRLRLRRCSTTCSSCSSSPAARCPHALMMMVPEPWSRHESMSAELKAFYEFHSCFLEPWDGPRLHRLHRRHPDRRDPRSQRPPPLALGRPRTASS